MGVENLAQFHISIITLDDFCLGLKNTHNLPDSSQFFRRYLRSLVEQDDIAEFYLLDHEILYVFLINLRFEQIHAALEVALHSERIHHSHDTVEPADTILDIFHAHRGNRADGLCDGFGLADAACLDDDIVEPVHLRDIMQLLYEIHFQGAADTSILQCHQTLIFLADDAAFLDEVSVDIHFADVIDNDGKLDASLIV